MLPRSATSGFRSGPTDTFGERPPLIEVEGLPLDAAGLTPQDRRLFFASMQPGTGVLSVAENGGFEVTSVTLAAIAPKLGPGAPPPFLAGPRARCGPPTHPSLLRQDAEP
jgi:hypothetical protein